MKNYINGTETIRVAICDDVPASRDILAEKVRNMFPLAVLELYSSGRELLESGTQADILFLDIQMPEMDGMEVARLFREQKRETLIIFVTAATEYVMIQAGGVHTKILLKDIIYAEVFNRKVIIHTTGGETEYYGKLSDLEKKTGADFFRPHRSYLIHFKYVKKYDAASIDMGCGTALIAKQNYPEFVRQYLKYNQRKGRELHLGR